MNKFLSIFVLCLFCSISWSQEQEHPDLLVTDSSWKKETFTFPLSFAPNIPYQGIEEAQFTAGWRHQDSDEFWSYIFVWKIDHPKELSPNELEIQLQNYFDGLMRMEQNGSKEAGVFSTTALIVKQAHSTERSSYLGKVKTFDAFSLKKAIVLNVKIDQQLDPDNQQLFVVFRFSIQDFEKEVWKKLDQVQLSSSKSR